jgi:hypothetical protein
MGRKPSRRRLGDEHVLLAEGAADLGGAAASGGPGQK